MSSQSSGDHVEDTIQNLAALHQAHLNDASWLQRAANRTTQTLGRPIAVVALLLLVALWLGGNLIAGRAGMHPIDAPPFTDLELTATIVALVASLLILTTQRHADQLADKRAQLTLQIATLSEKKVAKIIELLEEQRRDNPLLANRADDVADQMKRPTNPAENLDRIERASPRN